MNSRIRKMGEDGFGLVDIMVGVAVIGLLHAIILGFFYVNTKDNGQLRSIAQEMEAWSVANPVDSLSHESSFPLKDFISKSGSESTLSTEYNVKRISTTDDSLLCFIENKDGGKMLAYSYQKNKLVGRDLCKF